MTSFLQHINENVWLVVEEGWTKPEMHHSQWTIEEKTIASYNRKAMNAIFNGVSKDEFKRIFMAKVAK